MGLEDTNQGNSEGTNRESDFICFMENVFPGLPTF